MLNLTVRRTRWHQCHPCGLSHNPKIHGSAEDGQRPARNSPKRNGANGKLCGRNILTLHVTAQNTPSKRAPRPTTKVPRGKPRTHDHRTRNIRTGPLRNPWLLLRNPSGSNQGIVTGLGGGSLFSICCGTWCSEWHRMRWGVWRGRRLGLGRKVRRIASLGYYHHTGMYGIILIQHQFLHKSSLVHTLCFSISWDNMSHPCSRRAMLGWNVYTLSNHCERQNQDHRWNQSETRRTLFVLWVVFGPISNWMVSYPGTPYSCLLGSLRGTKDGDVPNDSKVSKV